MKDNKNTKKAGSLAVTVTACVLAAMALFLVISSSRQKRNVEDTTAPVTAHSTETETAPDEIFITDKPETVQPQFPERDTETVVTGHATDMPKETAPYATVPESSVPGTETAAPAVETAKPENTVCILGVDISPDNEPEGGRPESIEMPSGEIYTYISYAEIAASDYDPERTVFVFTDTGEPAFYVNTYSCGHAGHSCRSALAHDALMEKISSGCPHCGSPDCGIFLRDPLRLRVRYCDSYDIHDDPAYYCPECGRFTGEHMTFVNTAVCPYCGERVEGGACHSCPEYREWALASGFYEDKERTVRNWYISRGTEYEGVYGTP